MNEGKLENFMKDRESNAPVVIRNKTCSIYALAWIESFKFHEKLGWKAWTDVLILV